MGSRVVLALAAFAVMAAGCASSDQDAATMDAAPGANAATDAPAAAPKNMPGRPAAGGAGRAPAPAAAEKPAGM